METETERLISCQVGLLASASLAGLGSKWLMCKHPQGTQVFSPGVWVLFNGKGKGTRTGGEQ